MSLLLDKAHCFFYVFSDGGGFNYLSIICLFLYFLLIYLFTLSLTHFFFFFHSREHMSSFSLFFPAPRYCEMRKLLPAATFSSFFIQHYYKQRHVSWLPTYDLVFKFYTQLDPPPDCWLELENSSVAELNDSSNITYPIHPISPKKRKKLLR